MTDAKFDIPGRQCGSGHTNSVLRHFVLILAAGTLLAMSAATALGQEQQQTPAKPSVGLDVQILTHIGSADFSAYMAKLSTTVKHNWTASLPEAVKAGETGEVVIHVQVRRDGTFLNDTPKVETSARRNSLDNAAIAAIRASTPFPDLPSGFHGSDVDLRMTFLYNLRCKAEIIRNP
jgi:TonB family protein